MTQLVSHDLRCIIGVPPNVAFLRVFRLIRQSSHAEGGSVCKYVCMRSHEYVNELISITVAVHIMPCGHIHVQDEQQQVKDLRQEEHQATNCLP